MSKDKLQEATSSTLHVSNSRERQAVISQTEELTHLGDQLSILREKLANNLAPCDDQQGCGECGLKPHTTFDRINVNNHHIKCLTHLVKDLIHRYQP